MKFLRLQLKTSLSLMIVLLSLLTVISVGIGWNTLHALGEETNAQASRRLEASQEMRKAYDASGASNSDAAVAMLRVAVKRFDKALEEQSVQAAEGIAQQYQRAQYIFGGLIALAVLLALLACRTVAQTVLHPLKQIGAHFERMASGDLTERIELLSGNEIGMLYAGLKRMQDNLGRVVGCVRLGMEHINAGSQHIVLSNNDLSNRTEEQAATLQQTAASMEQLSSTVKQNADNARQANQLAASASEVAQRGGQAVGDVVTTMQGISASSREISDIVGVIDSIAFQTNILALNAAVEAARAGEQGKGFAVVAAEVRALAQRSAQAAKEIKRLIDDSVKKVTEGSEQVEQAGATMEEIVVSVARVTDIMGEISAATSEQSTGIDQINRAVTQMDDVTRRNAAMVQESAVLATSVREQAAWVNEAVSKFRTLDTHVLEVSLAPKPAAKSQSGSAAIAGRTANRMLGVERSKAPAVAGGAPAITLSAPPRAADPTPAYAGSAGAAPLRKTGSEDDWEEF